MTKGQNLTINGSGNYPGGQYDKISIRGDGTINTDVECSAFHIFGTSEALENLKTGSVKVFGEAEVKGNMESDEMLIMGTMAVGGRAALKKMKILGTLDVGENLTGDEANIKGTIAVGGDVEYETFESSGGFEIKGLLNADKINISLRFGQSFAEEIGGGMITVKKKSNSFLPFGKETGILTAKVIEGDIVYLENTKADIVRGKKVKIGTGCQIGTVEYTNELTQDQSSTIKTKTKL
ncbi:cytoplasmic protein [Neobacillus niacini]|uniref:cytoplasmic protein n=1 Tax=Neobacillus niacini TaxID=86668 RepID=UPI002FFD8E99